MKQMHHMDYEVIQPSTTDNDDYINFMCNPDNEYNCKDCPERGVNTRDYGLSCGQQVCWVTCHCASSTGDDED